MGGQIGVESEVGKGSRFFFSVRLAPVPARTKLALQHSVEVRALASALNPEPAAMHSLRVLVAEDNVVNQKLTSELLRRDGHTAVVVGDGRQAVMVADDQAFDLILMDVQMPAMDGLKSDGRDSGCREWHKKIYADHCNDRECHEWRSGEVPGGRHGWLSHKADRYREPASHARKVCVRPDRAPISECGAIVVC